MKRRYLFPFVYIIADAVSLLLVSIFPLPAIVSSLSIPSGYLLRFILRTIGVSTYPIGSGYFVGVGTILQMYLLGLLWELFVDRVQKCFRRRRLEGIVE